MKLKQAIKIEEVLGRKLPVDMYSNMSYYSDSREEWVDIMDIDVVHAIRILRKHIGKVSDEKPDVNVLWLD